MILVTGGLGMIGAHTARALTDLGCEVVVTSHRHTEVPSFLADRVTVESVDVTDRHALLALRDRNPISTIVHLAGSVDVGDPVGFFRNDSAGLFNVLDAARQWRVDRVAVASSLGAYLGCTAIPWHEDLALPAEQAPHPVVAFKRAVEPLTVNALQDTGIQPVVLRIGSTWGPLMDPESPFNPVPPYISAVLRGTQPALNPAEGGDFCYAPDAGRAIASLITADKLGYDTYNVSSGSPYTNRELVAAVEAAAPVTTHDLRPTSAATTYDDIPYLDITRLTAETGYRPAFDLSSAVADYVRWRTDNPR